MNELILFLWIVGFLFTIGASAATGPITWVELAIDVLLWPIILGAIVGVIARKTIEDHMDIE